jgi:hypothetical protein
MHVQECTYEAPFFFSLCNIGPDIEAIETCIALQLNLKQIEGKDLLFCKMLEILTTTLHSSTKAKETDSIKEDHLFFIGT